MRLRLRHLLILRTGNCAHAQILYVSVVVAKTLSWAKLGVARSLLDEGQISNGTGTLENLINDALSYADAYDELGST